MNPLKPYLLVFDEAVVPRDTLAAYLNTRGEVFNWQAYLRGSIVVVSNRSPSELQLMIHTGFPTLLFLITELIPAQIQGWLPGGVWQFINNPTPYLPPPPATSLAGLLGLTGLSPPPPK
jgi:hypothetical protein